MKDPTLRTIHRRTFETSGFRTVTLARGLVKFPDGRHSRYNVRLMADPGADGGIRLIVEDINREPSKARSLKLTRKS